MVGGVGVGRSLVVDRAAGLAVSELPESGTMVERRADRVNFPLGSPCPKFLVVPTRAPSPVRNVLFDSGRVAQRPTLLASAAQWVPHSRVPCEKWEPRISTP